MNFKAIAACAESDACNDFCMKSFIETMFKVTRIKTFLISTQKTNLFCVSKICIFSKRTVNSLDKKMKIEDRVLSTTVLATSLKLCGGFTSGLFFTMQFDGCAPHLGSALRRVGITSLKVAHEVSSNRMFNMGVRPCL